jgi:hypothetical protein
MAARYGKLGTGKFFERTLAGAKAMAISAVIIRRRPPRVGDTSSKTTESLGNPSLV